MRVPALSPVAPGMSPPLQPAARVGGGVELPAWISVRTFIDHLECPERASEFRSTSDTEAQVDYLDLIPRAIDVPRPRSACP